ncbi:MAG: hypothetical protein ACKO26_18300, partial [Planctomycetota bacterium]
MIAPHLLAICLALHQPGAPGGELVQAHPDWPDILVHRDTCNVFVIRDGDSAILVNLCDGGVLPRLGKAGISKVDWILSTPPP